MNTILEEIKEELKIVKNLKHIEVLEFEIRQKEENLNGKKILYSIVEKLDLMLHCEASHEPYISVSFRDDPDKKIYSLEIKFVERLTSNGEDRKYKIELSVYYTAPEHHSLSCNNSTEFIGGLSLKDQTDEEIANWFLSLRGKIKENVNCYYCGQINIHH
jgi:hypothetical protein